ncbi:hypothetical protein V2J09_017897 [Rumex salicifolius]
MLFTFNVIVKQVLGLEPNEPTTIVLLEHFKTFMRGLNSLPLYIPGTPYAKAVQARSRISSTVKSIIEERRRRRNGGDYEKICDTKRNDFLGTLLCMDTLSEDEKEEHHKIRKDKKEDELLTWEDFRKMDFTQHIQDENYINGVIEFIKLANENLVEGHLFDGTNVHGRATIPASGTTILRQQERASTSSKKVSGRKRSRQDVGTSIDGVDILDGAEHLLWKKKSIFFDLPYWENTILGQSVMLVVENGCRMIILIEYKSYVTNKAQQEGSIAEGYILEETTSFCSRYLKAVETIFNKSKRNDDIVGSWDDEVHNIDTNTEEGGLRKALVCGLNRHAKRIHVFMINGYKFRTADREEFLKTQNSGVMVEVDGAIYYGKIIELQKMS